MTIKCELCGVGVHSVEIHLKKYHPEMTLAEYQRRFPEAPVLSPTAQLRIQEKLLEKANMAKKDTTPAPEAIAVDDLGSTSQRNVMKPFHEVFEFGSKKEAMNARGQAIPIECVENANDSDLVPAINSSYVFNIDEVKNVLIGLQQRIPVYVWGHKGAGKTELYEQIAARTGRPMMRVQHTANTEESHITGQWTVSDGQTVFSLGPLPMAMIHGWIYCADEYDFASPAVLSVYQAVLEGKSLVIKEADKAHRVIKPHPNFRFVASGNTNGSGDETGLYQGTMVQNSANYDRFGMVIKKEYMSAADEVRILMGHLEKFGMDQADADKMVKFANLVREAYANSKISDTISPRTLIMAGKISLMRVNFRLGIALSFTNKLSRVDREVVEGIAHRVFGA